MNRSAPCFTGAALLLAVLAHGCSNDDGVASASLPADPASEATKPAGFRFSTGKFEIQPGDTFECFYTDTVTTEQLNVRAATGKQGPGGHHITVYYTDQKAPVGHHACTDAEMIGLHQIAAADEGGEVGFALPEGYATKVPAGKQLVVQAHYIRTEPGPLVVEDVVVLDTVETSKVKAFANGFAVHDGEFAVPPRGPYTSTTECVAPRDLDVLLLIGHMHEAGSRFKLERVDEAGKPIDTLYEAEWEPLYTSHPPVNKYDPATPLHLAKGTRLRQTCSWNNTEANELRFPREMCDSFAYYIPDDGFIVCESSEVKR